MRGWLVDAAVRVLTVLLVGTGLMGVLVAAQHSGRVSFVIAVGSMSGVLVGATARWSREGDVRWRDVPVFAAAGMGVLLVLAGASVLGSGATWTAIVGLVLWWALRRSARQPAMAPRARTTSAVRMTHGPESSERTPIAQLSTPLLCRLWDDLVDEPTSSSPPDAAAGLPHPAAVSMRVEVLDELERRDPEGFARWMEREAPHNPHTYVDQGDP